MASISCNRLSEEKPVKKTEQKYAISILPTPVLSSTDFSEIFGGNDGKTLKLNKKKFIEEVEFIAFPQTVFTVEEEIRKNNINIFRVTSKEYPYKNASGYYIDSRFVEIKKTRPIERVKNLPDKNTIINKLISMQGSIYVWGGNYSSGISEMLNFYRPSADLPTDITTRWILKGVDCSGLLYEATNGYTPRNTESLFYFGTGVDIENLKADKIIQKLRSLDIIVYKRHVIIVLDNKKVIESTITEGVKVKSLEKTIINIIKNIHPANEYKADKNNFVVRRWYPE